MPCGYLILPSTILPRLLTRVQENNGKKENGQFIYLHRILVPEGWLADKEFVEQDAESPPVDGYSVTCQISWLA